MQRVQAYVDTKTAKQLIKLAAKQGISLSNAASDILKNYFAQEAKSQHPTVDPEEKAYFLRIINTLNQVLMCVYDKDKTSVKAKSAAECIEKITRSVLSRLSG